jgi:hypothetical protein
VVSKNKLEKLSYKIIAQNKKWESILRLKTLVAAISFDVNSGQVVCEKKKEKRHFFSLSFV